MNQAVGSLSVKELLTLLWVVSATVSAATWGTVPWRWGFPLLWFVVAFVLGAVCHRWRSWGLVWVNIVALTGLGPITAGWFYGDLDPSWWGAAHVGAIFALVLLLGSTLGWWFDGAARRN